MRIGLFLDQWREGGVPVFLDRLERQLTDDGHTVFLILADPFAKREALAKELYLAIKSRLKERCISLDLNSYPKEWKKSHFRHAILSLDLDCLLINQFYNHLSFLKNISSEVPLVPILHTDLDYYYHEFLQMMGSCSAYIAVSKEIERKCLAFSGPDEAHKIHYIPYGIVSETNFDPEPKGAMQIMYSARLDPLQKRCQDLIPIWNGYCQRGGTGMLTILGSGRAEKLLAEGLRESIATGRVLMKGHLPSKDALAVMAKGDVLLNISNFEGLPQVVLEGTSLGLFPLLSDIPSGHREIVETLKRGTLCHLGDHTAFVNELLKLESNLSLIRSQRAINRSDTLKQYSLPDCCKKYLNAFQQASAVPRKKPVLSPYKSSFKERIQRAVLLIKYKRHFGSIGEPRHP